MSNAKRRTLIIVQAAIVVLFVLAVLLGMGATNVKADDVQIDSAAADEVSTKINNLFVNGNVPENYDASTQYAGRVVAALNDESDVQNFLKGELTLNGSTATVGYLTGPMTFSWSQTFTNEIMADNLIFDGNGFEVTLDIKNWNTNTSTRSLSDLNDQGQNTYFTATNGSSDLDINGGFIGYVPPTSKIINTKFKYNYTVSGKNAESGKEGTQNSGTGGLVAGYCNGVIDNCSITLVKDKSITVTKWSVTTSYPTIARHSYSFGGIVGVLAGSNAVVSNCSVDLQSGSLIKVEVHPSRATSGISTNRKGNGRAFVGGLVGWGGASASAYNLTTYGSGTLEAAFGGEIEEAIGQVGGAIGSCTAGSTNTTKADPRTGTATSGTNAVGQVNGIINNWTGLAKSRVEGSDGKNVEFYPRSYSPFNKTGSFEVQGMVVGVSGNDVDGSETVRNIYSVKDMYESGNNNYSIGYSAENRQGKKTANVVNIQYRKDADNSLTAASSDRAYLIWGSEKIDSAIWAVYDISKDTERHILWTTSVVKKTADGTIGETLNASYYDKCDSLEDARTKYAVTYTPLIRGNYPRVDIEYEFGRAVYLSKVFVETGSDGHTTIYGDAITGSEAVDCDDIQYGSELKVPEIRLYTDKSKMSDRNQAVKIISHEDRSFWQTLKGSSTDPDPAAGVKEVGEYTTFLYLKNPASGLNYSNIHLLDTSARLVAYIKDDENFQEFAKEYKKNTGNEYSHVDAAGVKTFDWQPRITQTVVPKSVDLDIKEPTGISFTNVANGARSAQYQGSALVYTASVNTNYLVAGDKDTGVTATLEYYNADENYNKLGKVAGAIDVGNYLVHPVSLSNPNYCIDSAVADYRLNIRKRNTILQPNEKDFDIQKVGSEYRINLTYNALEQIIKYGSGFNPLDDAQMSKNGWAFYFYNVISDDAAMIQIEIMGMNGESDYDAINVPEEGAGGSYKVVISFADGDASENYNLPNETTVI
ncbi:MAG: hypothetical protein K2N32_01400, partial [Clostridia bacterium]|nr:hypothetical protein [Clostridia bacterium]